MNWPQNISISPTLILDDKSGEFTAVLFTRHWSGNSFLLRQHLAPWQVVTGKRSLGLIKDPGPGLIAFWSPAMANITWRMAAVCYKTMSANWWIGAWTKMAENSSKAGIRGKENHFLSISLHALLMRTRHTRKGQSSIDVAIGGYKARNSNGRRQVTRTWHAGARNGEIFAGRVKVPA